MTAISGIVSGAGAKRARSAATSIENRGARPPAAGRCICSVSAVASSASQPRSCASARSETMVLHAAFGSPAASSLSQASR